MIAEKVVILPVPLSVTRLLSLSFCVSLTQYTIDIPTCLIDDLLLEKECNRIIREYHLSAKEWTNVKTIIKGMFEYAMRKHYLKENPFLNVAILTKFRQVTRKTGRTETYNTEELDVLYDYLEKMYAETSDVSFLAVRVNFYLGLRVDELVALK